MNNSEVPVPKTKCNTGRANLRQRVKVAQESNCADKTELKLTC